jgi:histone arginine demethylase JMJD6
LYEKYKDAEFKCGEDDDGHKLKIKLKYYLEYLIHNKDDSPLYLFESSLEDNKEARSMI